MNKADIITRILMNRHKRNLPEWQWSDDVRRLLWRESKETLQTMLKSERDPGALRGEWLS